MGALGLIAGKGTYPRLVLEQARRQGVSRIAVAAFEGETDPELASAAEAHCWMRVGQLGKLLRFFKDAKVDRAIMAGQITPGRLFDLRPDLKAVVLLARLKERNAESLFGAVADALEKAGIKLLPATTFMEDFLAAPGLVAGPKLSKSQLKDVEFGWPLAREISRMNIGQSVVVKKGTVLAVEGYDGTNATLRRGGGIGQGDSILIKVSKPRQDMRFDVPVIGPDTVKIAAECGVSCIAVEARKTLLLGADELRQLASHHRITVWAKES
ncbi:MAG: UDP-2,3-diacylglucosamine diphosphatase LpxI [Methylacidiphilales bacterium]|nr:UDP-2,3-diacylglucosamine diphosphatase LpxI [Candidatus Methylacidiphilales bacterium]